MIFGKAGRTRQEREVKHIALLKLQGEAMPEEIKDVEEALPSSPATDQGVKLFEGQDIAGKA